MRVLAFGSLPRPYRPTCKPYVSEGSHTTLHSSVASSMYQRRSSSVVNDPRRIFMAEMP